MFAPIKKSPSELLKIASPGMSSPGEGFGARLLTKVLNATRPKIEFIAPPSATSSGVSVVATFSKNVLLTTSTP